MPTSGSARSPHTLGKSCSKALKSRLTQTFRICHLQPACSTFQAPELQAVIGFSHCVEMPAKNPQSFHLMRERRLLSRKGLQRKCGPHTGSLKLLFGFGYLFWLWFRVIALQPGRAPSLLAAMPLGFLQFRRHCHSPHHRATSPITSPFLFFFFFLTLLFEEPGITNMSGVGQCLQWRGGYWGHLLLRTKLLK